MPTVTVAGAHHQTVTLHYDSTANAALARQLAAAITAGVQGGSIVPAVDTDGPPPTLPPGKTGEFVQTMDGLTILPHGYKAVVDTAPDAVIFGSGDNGESVLASTGLLDFFATGGSGTVVGGGGDSLIFVPVTDAGAWSINTGNGDDTILALGNGNDTISAGGGHNSITLGDGHDVVQTTGSDVVVAGNGHETIAAVGSGSDVVYGNGSTLFFVDSGAGATVFGGTGSDTFFGGSGPDVAYGGSAGHNFLLAGSGAATLFGGGDGDQLFAAGGKGQELHAGAGNETLFGAAAFGADTFYGSAGSTQMFGGSGKDVFAFVDGQAGGHATIQGFAHGRDLVDLQGYGKDAVKDALKSQHVVGTTNTITLSDHTTITFIGVGKLTASDFAGGGGQQGHGGHGHHDDTFHGHH